MPALLGRQISITCARNERRRRRQFVYEELAFAMLPSRRALGFTVRFWFLTINYNQAELRRIAEDPLEVVEQ